MNEAIGLLRLNQLIKRALALNFGQPILVHAEIAACNINRGHYYLDLIERQDGETVAQSSAILWQNVHARLSLKLGKVLDSLLQEGLHVQFSAKVEFHERYGLKLTLLDIDPTFTFGQLALEQQAILNRLALEGLIEKNKTAPLPPAWRRLGVVSSSKAAGLADLMAHLRNNPFGYKFDIRVFEAAVQGQSAPSEIATAIKNAEAADCEAILLVRGGGARLDLIVFDTYEVCAAIAACKVPVLTGIGHETDSTLADQVAFMAHKTPTAVAEWIIRYQTQFEFRLQELSEAIRYVVGQKSSRQQEIQRQLQQAIQQSVLLLWQRSNLALDNKAAQLKRSAAQVLKNTALRFEYIGQLIAQADPARVLQRGFTITMANGMPLKHPDQVSTGTQLTTITASGEIRSVVE